MDVEIRLVGPDDAALFERVAEEVFDALISPKRLRAYLSRSENLMLLAVVDGEVVGQCAAVIHLHPDKPSELYVDEVGVAPSWRCKGVAKRLMQAMSRLGCERGCEEAWVGTEPDNSAACGLYRALGAEALPIVMFEYDLPSADGQR